MCYHRCELLDLNIVFENVKLRILLTLWIGALYYCKKYLIFSTVQKFFKMHMSFFLIPFCFKAHFKCSFLI
jgi:hypothetical protein